MNKTRRLTRRRTCFRAAWAAWLLYFVSRKRQCGMVRYLPGRRRQPLSLTGRVGWLFAL